MKEWFLKRVRRGNQKETLFGLGAFKMLNRTTEDEGLLQLGLRFIMSRELLSLSHHENQRCNTPKRLL